MEQIGVYVISYLRPSGIFLDIHTQAFVIRLRSSDGPADPRSAQGAGR